MLIRHGATAWTEAGRYQGQADPPLSPAGEADAARLAHSLAGQPIGLVLSSPLLRALETARPLAAATGAALEVDARLAELAYGQWEGLTQAEIKVRWPDALRMWKRNPSCARPPDGETLAAAAARTGDLLADLPEHASAGPIVAIVTHSVIIRLMLLAARGETPDGLHGIAVSPGSMQRLRLYPGSRAVAETSPSLTVSAHAR